MGIVDEDIVRVREASDIVAIVSQHLQLKRVGSRWQGLCPFHAEKTPSFSVNGEMGVYHCFGCKASGDVITFVREMEHLDFPGSVEWLAGKAGIQLRYTDQGENEGRKKRKKLLEAMAKAVDWYHERLLSGDDGAEARGYLRSRGFDGEKVRQYRLGWAPDDWDALARSLKLSNDVLRGTPGLGFINKRQRQQDLFRGRVLFPILDVQGDPVAFGGRILPGHDGPKYINSAESPIYAKSKTLYGLNWHKASIVEADEAIVCEGYTDVIGFADAGVPRAVATCGTALTEEHVRSLKRYARRVVLAFDPDEAGQSAAERFYEWEQKYEVDVAVADLPRGVDPADLARDDPERLATIVDEATPFLGFRVQRTLRAGSLASPEGRARSAEAALAVIREHPNELVRDQYVMQVSDRTGLEADQLRSQLRRAPSEVRSNVSAPDRSAGEDGPEFEALRVAIHRPDDVADLLYEHLFVDELAAGAFRALADGGSPHEILERADPRTRELLHRLWVEDTDAEGDEVITRLVREALRRQIRVLDAESRSGGDAMAISMEVNRLGKLLHVLDDERTSIRSSDDLLAWLSEGVEETS